MAKRLRIPFQTQAAFDPIASGIWDDATAVDNRLLAVDKTGTVNFSTAGAAGQTRSWTTGQKRLDRYLTSPPLMGNQTISGTIAALVGTAQVHAGSHAITEFEAYVVSYDGSSVRGVLLGVGNYGTGTQLGGLGSRWFADTGTAISSVNALDGDRIVCGFGFTDVAGSSPSAAGNYRDSIPATDYTAESQTPSSSTGDGWVEFSANLVFWQVPPPVIQFAGSEGGGTFLPGQTPWPTRTVTTVSLTVSGGALAFIHYEETMSVASGTTPLPLAVSVNSQTGTLPAFTVLSSRVVGPATHDGVSSATRITVLVAYSVGGGTGTVKLNAPLPGSSVNLNDRIAYSMYQVPSTQPSQILQVVTGDTGGAAASLTIPITPLFPDSNLLAFWATGLVSAHTPTGQFGWDQFYPLIGGTSGYLQSGTWLFGTWRPNADTSAVLTVPATSSEIAGIVLEITNGRPGPAPPPGCVFGAISVTILSPLPVGSLIQKTDGISFTIEDTSTQFRRILPAITYPNLGRKEFIHDGEDFLPAFVGSTRTLLSAMGAPEKWRYDLVAPFGAWPDVVITMTPFAFDLTGSESPPFVPDPPSPDPCPLPGVITIAILSPTVGTTIPPDSTLSFTLQDASWPFRRILPGMNLPGLKRREFTHDGDNFVEPYLGSTRTKLSTSPEKWRYDLKRAGGFPIGEIDLFPYSFDTAGGESP